jgi:16S rRNA G966 N2-methylase RsmD
MTKKNERSELTNDLTLNPSKEEQQKKEKNAKSCELSTAASNALQTENQKVCSPELSIEAKAELDALDGLFTAENNMQWRIGDAIIALVDIHKVKAVRIAKHLSKKANTISSYMSVARAFEVSNRSKPYYQCKMASEAAQRLRKATKDSGKVSVVTAPEILQKIEDDKGKKMSNGKIGDGKVTIRNCMNTADKLHYGEAIAADVINSNPNKFIESEIHKVDFKALGYAKFNLIHLDPPYADYERTTDGKFSQFSRNHQTLTACDNATAEKAIETTVAAVKHLAEYLADDGVMILWQSANALRWEIGKAIEDSGLRSRIALVWNKNRTQPGDFVSPLSYSCEFAYIITWPDAKIRNQDDSSRKNIFLTTEFYEENKMMEFEPVRKLSHQFEKPAELNEYLVSKFTRKRGIVLDGFGCSGSMSIAAAGLDRQYVYVESNPDCFALGIKRIEEKAPKDNSPDMPK